MFIAPPVNYALPPSMSLVEVLTPRDVDYNMADLTISLSERITQQQNEIVSYVAKNAAFIDAYGKLSNTDVSNMLGRPVIYVSPEYCVICWLEKNSRKTVKLEFSGLLSSYDNVTLV